MNRWLLAAAISVASALSVVAGEWWTEGFEAFRRGTFGNAGHNLYVSRAGVLQRIFQYDLDRNGWFDLVFANCQDHHEASPSYLYDVAGGRRTAVLKGQGSQSVSMADIPYRSKTTLKLFLDKNEKTKAYSYEISNIEILRGTAESLTQPNCKISMDVGILLNGVCDVNGAPFPP